ncbi:MAG: CDP-alcohol phosphatidyltransferase family protein [bacterium]
MTISRILAIPFVIVLLIKSQNEISYKKTAIILLVIMQFSDILDGYLARMAIRFANTNNHIGKLLDPLADKLYIDSTYITLSLLFNFPIWATYIVVTRDVLLIFGWIAIDPFRFHTISPNVWGKITDTLQAFLIFAFLLEVPKIVFLTGVITMLMFTIYSGIVYSIVGMKTYINSFVNS